MDQEDENKSNLKIEEGDIIVDESKKRSEIGKIANAEIIFRA